MEPPPPVHPDVYDELGTDAAANAINGIAQEDEANDHPLDNHDSTTHMGNEQDHAVRGEQEANDGYLHYEENPFAPCTLDELQGHVHDY
eukprot:750852-Rhodomonas_salina.1